jgi:hypothetical protein
MSETLKINPKRLKRSIVPIDALVPNEWNPNKMDERTYEAERESIREHGFIDPCLVRTHPTQDGKHEIIDGEHRWKAARDEGYVEVIIDSLGSIPDVAAKRLTIIFNETRGDADIALLGKLMASINAEADGEEWWSGLPYGESERNHLLELGSVDWDNFVPAESGGGSGGDAPPAFSVTLSFDQEQHEHWQTFVGMLGREWELEAPEEIALRAVQAQAEKL